MASCGKVSASDGAILAGDGAGRASDRSSLSRFCRPRTAAIGEGRRNPLPVSCRSPHRLDGTGIGIHSTSHTSERSTSGHLATTRLRVLARSSAGVRASFISIIESLSRSCMHSGERARCSCCASDSWRSLCSGFALHDPATVAIRRATSAGRSASAKYSRAWLFRSLYTGAAVFSASNYSSAFTHAGAGACSARTACGSSTSPKGSHDAVCFIFDARSRIGVNALWKARKRAEYDCCCRRRLTAAMGVLSPARHRLRCSRRLRIALEIGLLQQPHDFEGLADAKFIVVRGAP